MAHVTPGAEILLASPPASLSGRRLGLLANPSSIDRAMASIPTRIHNHPDLNLVALYGPEHGVRGNAQAGEHVSGETDPATGLPVYSLYGVTESPSADALDAIDVLLIDMQDIGARFTTYISSLAAVIDACAAHSVDVVILDRPNPLPGDVVAGNVLDPAYTSFVGCHPITTLHGLTLGEFGLLYARDKGLPSPRVIRMEGWARSLWYDECDLPWVFPSPNLPTLDSVTAYRSTCLFEGTKLSEGRGTTRPFELFGAPWIDADRLAADLREQQFPGVGFRPAWFVPTFSKHQGEVCGGVQVYVNDRNTCEPISLGVHLLTTVRRLYPDDFAWLTPNQDRYFIDLLAGTDKLRTTIDSDGSIEDLLAGWEQEAATFRQSRSDILLYT